MRFKYQNSKLQRGFTLTETLVVVGIFIILTALSIPLFRLFQKESGLINSIEEIVNTLRNAQNKTLASEGASQWGVYFSTSTTPHQYILFKGEIYATRDTSADQIHKLSQTIEIYEINLEGEGTEVVFSRITGTTNQSGEVSLRLKNDVSKTRQIIIESSGQIASGSETTSTDENRVKDSRHVHFDYNRVIDTATEKLILTFDATVTKEIIIANYLEDGQIYWESEVDIGGEVQKLKIHTHRLNDPALDTQFCVHRDRRYNTKTLKLEIDGDISGDLIQYDANGQTTQGTSIYVSIFDWQ